MTQHRLCISCVEDWAEFGDGFCLSCRLEQLRSVALRGNDYAGRNARAAEWWGASERDVNPEDISDGFYVTEIGPH